MESITVLAAEFDRRAERITELTDEVTRLRRIVRDLAESDPVADLGGCEDDYWVCLLCPDGWDDVEWRERHDDVVHHEHCPWVLAKAEVGE